MKILSLTPFFLYPHHQAQWQPRFDPLGGMHLLTYGLTRSLLERGYKHEVLTMGLPGTPRDYELEQGITVHARRYPVLPIPSKLEGYFGLVAAWGLASLVWVFQERQRLSQEISLVHAHCDGSGTAVFLGRKTAQLLGAPLVTQIHSSRLLTQHPTTLFEHLTDPVSKAMELKAVRASKHVLVLTDNVRNQFINDWDVNKESISKLACLTSSRFVENDTPVRREQLRKRFSLPQDKPIVLYLGRLAVEKGVEHLIRSIAAFKQRRDCHFLICGDGPEREMLTNMIGELGLHGQVTITGFVPHEEVPSIIALAEFGIVPSEYEELGLVILEFMSMGKPCVVHNVSGVDQLVQHEETGYLVPPYQPESLADAMTYLLDNPELIARMGQNAMKIPARDYSLDRAAEQLAEIYQRLGAI